jgi:hypothetical protein
LPFSFEGSLGPVGYNWYLYSAGDSDANVTIGLYLLQKQKSHKAYFYIRVLSGEALFETGKIGIDYYYWWNYTYTAEGLDVWWVGVPDETYAFLIYANSPYEGAVVTFEVSSNPPPSSPDYTTATISSTNNVILIAIVVPIGVIILVGIMFVVIRKSRKSKAKPSPPAIPMVVPNITQQTKPFVQVPQTVPSIPQQTSDYIPQAGQYPGQPMNMPPPFPMVDYGRSGDIF